MDTQDAIQLALLAGVLYIGYQMVRAVTAPARGFSSIFDRVFGTQEQASILPI